MHSRLHEMCEFLEFEGADYRHLPPNVGSDELLSLWRMHPQTPRQACRGKAKAPVKAQLREHRPGRTEGPTT